ncbi:BTE_HP_G0020480.mRNA.1.CDS.1 [Saccharomyces cerevisiae]|nr:BTE_HP_G0020480.mRNA.1.CDS.1 [Saccharomyces cerevisiae]CAI6602691.1 BTE_HP_G0020480.mRNA.1.CDS.1 [Saccharomyces cerevisiae]
MLSYQGYTKGLTYGQLGHLDETLEKDCSKNVQDYIHQLGFIPAPFVNLYPNANPSIRLI